MTFQITIEIDTGDYFGIIIALGKNDPEMLVILLAIAFQSIGRAGFVVKPGFSGVNFAMFQEIEYFRFADLAAVHSASGMATVFKPVHSPVKSLIISILRTSGPE